MLALVVLAVTLLCFAAVNYSNPDGPLATLAGPFMSDPDAADEVERLKEDFNLDDPFPVRYAKWLGGMATGNFGRSLATRTPVSTIMAQKFPKTLLLMFLAQLAALVIAIPWAIFAARKPHGFLDKLSTFGSFGVIAIPAFALGPVLLYLFALRFKILPATFQDDNLFVRLKSLILPVTTLALGLAAGYQRLLRTDLGATLQEDFILMAKAKGIPPMNILWRHALRPSLFSILTVFAINTGALVGGALVVETIFGIPGMGLELAEATIRDDYTVVLAGVVVISTGFVIMNLLADLLYSVIDPRVQDD